jgi:putative ABC transport system permease protein
VWRRDCGVAGDTMISIPSTLKISFRALWVNKMRSALTLLGIIIGVCAVITMLAVGTGARAQITEQIASMGSNLFIVVPGSVASGGVRMGAGTQATLTSDDADSILRECTAVSSVAPVLSGAAQVVFRQQNWSTGITGTTGGMLAVRDWTVEEGTFFSGQDVKAAAKVCVLGRTVADNLFFGQEPVGQNIRIKNVPFRVAGVLTPKGQSPGGHDQDDVVYIPLTAAQRRLFRTPFPGMVQMIYVKAASGGDMDTAVRQVTELLRQRHRIGQGEDNDFRVRNLTQFMQAAEQASRVMSLLLSAVASVSLLVGGIGIMNIMLVSVTERTREIGIRMAVGAKGRDIRLQFIIEAVVLSLLGGVVGIILGMTGSKLVSILAGWPTIVTLISILIAFVFSGLIGIFFGFYPAFKASRLDPIDALRYE